MNNQYFHARSDTAVRNLAAKLQSSRDDNQGGAVAYAKANKYYNEQAAVTQMKNLQYD